MGMPWPTSLTLGIGRFDEDHRHMFDLLSELDASVATGNLSGVRALFDELRAVTLVHFHEEEELMVRTGYPGAQTHMAEHERARQSLLALHGPVVGGRMNQISELMTQYTAGYFRGVLRDDGLFAIFLRERAAGSTRRVG